MATRYRAFIRTAAPVIPKPPAPTNFAKGAVSASTVSVTWSPVADLTVTGYNVYDVDTGNLLRSISGRTTAASTVTGLSSTHTYHMSIRAVNPSGESPDSNIITAVTSTPQGGTTMLMGSSVQNTNPGGYTQIDAIRIYRLSKVNATINTYSPKVIALSDDVNVPVTGGQASANALRSGLTTIFNAHPGIEIHYANGNEIDRKSPNLANYKSTNALIRGVIDDFIAAGYKISFWIDLTQNQINGSSDYEAGLKGAFAQYGDGVACSVYPPGRTNTTTNPTFTPYASYAKALFDLVANWGIGQVSCWETGIPVDPSNPNHRPVYAAGLAQYMYNQGLAYGIKVRVCIWWDNWSKPQDSSNPNNQFSADAAGAKTPDGNAPPTGKKATAVAWFGWQNYTQYL